MQCWRSKSAIHLDAERSGTECKMHNNIRRILYPRDALKCIEMRF